MGFYRPAAIIAAGGGKRAEDSFKGAELVIRDVREVDRLDWTAVGAAVAEVLDVAIVIRRDVAQRELDHGRGARTAGTFGDIERLALVGGSSRRLADLGRQCRDLLGAHAGVDMIARCHRRGQGRARLGHRGGQFQRR